MWPGPCYFVKGPVESGDWGGYRVRPSTGVGHNGQSDPWHETRYMARLPNTQDAFYKDAKKKNKLSRFGKLNLKWNFSR